jgi:Rrf2 family protein
MTVSKASAYGLHALMYMVRHVTQLPATVEAIAQTEGLPARDLSEVLQRLAQAGFVALVRGREKGYVFARPPEEIAPREVLDALEGSSLFDDCPREVRALFEEASIVAAAWNDLERRFGVLPQDTHPVKLQIKSLESRKRPRSEESSTRDT